MNKFEKELKKWAMENEQSALLESVEIIQKASESSLMAVGVFAFADKTSVFSAEELKNDIIARTNLPLETVQEIHAHGVSVASEAEICSKLHASEIIWKIQDDIRAGEMMLSAIMKPK